MRYIILILGLFLASCGGYNPQPVYQQPVVVAQPSQPPYQVIQDGMGNQQVVYSYNGQQMVMDYLLFNSLMNNGGYGSVNNYYVSHPTYRHVYSRSAYSSYKKVPSSGFRSTSNTPSSFTRTTSGSSKPTTFTRTQTSTFTKSSSSSSRSSGGFGRHK